MKREKKKSLETVAVIIIIVPLVSEQAAIDSNSHFFAIKTRNKFISQSPIQPEQAASKCYAQYFTADFGLLVEIAF